MTTTQNYGYSVRDRAFWIRLPSGLKTFKRGQEAFRYMLRNECNMPTRDVDRIVNECIVDRHERVGGDQ